MTGTAATVQLCKTKGQYLFTCKVSRYCISIFHGTVDVIGTVSMARHSEACIGYILYIHTDFKIPVFIFSPTNLYYFNLSITKTIFYYRRAQIRTFQDAI